MKHLKKFNEDISKDILDENGRKFVKDNSMDFVKGDYVASEHWDDAEDKDDSVFLGYFVKRIAFRKNEKDPFRDKRIAEVYFENEIGRSRMVGHGTGWFKVKPV